MRLARLLVPLARSMTSADRVELMPALTAIGAAAARQRAADAARRTLKRRCRTDGGRVEYVALPAVTAGGRKRIARGTLCAEQRGRAWMVDPSA